MHENNEFNEIVKSLDEIHKVLKSMESKKAVNIQMLEAREVAKLLHINKNAVGKLFARNDFPRSM